METPVTPPEQPMKPPLLANAGKSGNSLVIGLVVGLVLLVAAAFAAVQLGKRDGGKELTALQPAVVTIGPDGFVPSTVRIKQGQEVRWVNTDTLEHKIDADDTVLKDLGSGESLFTNESYGYPFDDKGTFQYFDPLSPEEYKGEVVVE